MPKLGSTLKYGNRDYIFNESVYNDLVKEKGLDLSFKDCNALIRKCNENIANVITEENDGFKLPLGLGYICAVRFIPKRVAINWNATKLNGGKFVYYNNLDTFGYSVGVRWFRIGRVENRCLNEIFMFKTCKKLSQLVSKRFKSGKMYSELGISDFIEIGRLENLYNKKYRKTLKE